MAYVQEGGRAARDISGLVPRFGVIRSAADDNGSQDVELVMVTRQDPGAWKQMRVLLNQAIAEGMSYPYRNQMDDDTFLSYYLAYHAFAVRPRGSGPDGEVLGCFYIKPNFPGRCDHICNGGFLTAVAHRRRGIARFCAAQYLVLARGLGYRASMFNLVFHANAGSMQLWRSTGFRELGIIPQAGLLADGRYSDASQFWYDLTSLDGAGGDGKDASDSVPKTRL